MKYFTRSCFHYILSLLVLLAFSQAARSQVLAQDSLALVDLYNSTSGNNWYSNPGWLTGSVGTWYGISINTNRVTGINLPGNNLNGAVAGSLAQLTSLSYINLSANHITSIPDLSGLSALDTLVVNFNRLTFSGLLADTGTGAFFLYAPQDSVDAPVDTAMLEQNTYILQTYADTQPGITDQFQWFKDGDSIPGATTRAYGLFCFDSTMQGNYTCRITNPALPALTLWRNTIHLSFIRLANAGSNMVVCADSVMLSATAPLSGTGSWALISGLGNIQSPNSPQTVVTNLLPGANVFRWTMSNNASCNASHAYVTITRDLPPTPPYAGPDMTVCSSQATLQGNIPATGIGLWTVVSGTGTVAQYSLPNAVVTGLSPGNNVLHWQIYNGVCPISAPSQVNIWRNDSLTSANAGPDQNLCTGTGTTLNADLPQQATGVWSVAAGTAIFADSTYYASPVSALSTGANILVWTINNTCQHPASDTLNIEVDNLLSANAGADTTIYYNPYTAYTLANGIAVATGGDGQYIYNWLPADNLGSATGQHPGFTTPDTGIYDFTLTVTDGHACTAYDSVRITVVKAGNLFVPTLFTPNGDGINEYFVIPDIQSYPGNELSVYDRNGQLVFHAIDYANNWGGYSNQGLLHDNTELSQDTYFYVLKLNDTKTLKGYVEIKR